MSSFDVSPDTQVVLLLTSRLRQSEHAPVSPLKPSEFVKVSKALSEMGLTAKDLVEEISLDRLVQFGAAEGDRVKSLLSRGLALSLAIEKWTGQGIWILGWSDPDYPAAYKEKLKGQAPPILFGIGDRELLNEGGVAVVGSREVDEQGVIFARRVAEHSADGGLHVVSGAARGVDREAMNGSLEHGGKAVGVLADGLARYAVSGPLREAISRNTLTLISPQPRPGMP